MKILTFKKNLARNLKGGYSLVEMLITLIVVSIIIVMLSNVLSIALRVSVLTSERSHVKNEMSNLLQKLDRDVSNAEYVFVDDVSDGILIIETADFRIRWERCDNDNPVLTGGAGDNGSLCQSYCPIDPATELSATTCSSGVTKRNYISSRRLLIEDFLAQEITSVNNAGFEDTRIKSAVITVKARHSNESLEINNLYKQITISSNNFII